MHQFRILGNRSHAWRKNLNALPVRVHQPSKQRTIRHPALHLLPRFDKAVRLRKQFHYKRRAKPRHPRKIGLRHPIQLLWQNISSIRTEQRPIRQKESRVRVKNSTALVTSPPIGKLSQNFGVPMASEAPVGACM
jgi:hypothetical protein